MAFDYFDDEAGQYAWELLAARDALLIGRLTYEALRRGLVVAVRGVRRQDQQHAEVRRLDHARGGLDWEGSSLIQGDLVEEVSKLKEEPGEDILMYGFGPVGEALLQNGLLDELRLWVHPVLAGVGEPGDMLLRQGNTAKLKLVDSKTFDSGVVVLSYAPAGKD